MFAGPTIVEGSKPTDRRGSANWYDVPYKTMVPKRGTGANLLVPVALSTSAVAFSSTRIENMYMNVGSAAGVAAKQLVDGTAKTVQDVDVSKVQAILNGTFKQRIHGPTGRMPTPPTPPYTGPKSYTVEGAGSPEWNGVYELDGESNPPTFKQAGSKVTHELYSYGRVWRLGVLGKDLAYVAATPSVLPPLAGWGIGTGPGPAGKAPAPHLKAGPL